jgi:beta-alanine--pyruvate transaminase
VSTTKSELDLQTYWMPFTANRQFKNAPRLVESAEGVYYRSRDGRRLIDGIAGMWCVNAGHGRAEIVEAVQRQVAEMDYATSFQMGHPAAFELAGELSAILPDDLGHPFFVNSGSEAVDTALKIALAFHRRRGEAARTRLIGRERAYHGVGFGGISVGGIGANRTPYGPLLPGVDHLPHTHDPERNAFSRGQPEHGVERADALLDLIALHGAETIAAVIVEPMSGSTGVLVPPVGYLERLREITATHGILLIFDEVITGFGRTGRLFALDHWGVEPDIVQFAKAITSGYFPFGGIGISDRLAATLDEAGEPWMHAYTYSAHPVGCAVALRTMDIILDEDFPAQAAAKGEHLLAGLKAALADHPNVGDVRGKGLMCGVEIVQDKATKAEFPASENIGVKVHAATQQRGLFSRLRGDVFCLAPPVVTTTEQLDRIVEILAAAIDEVLPA